jgi:glycosyltransferase involved in cell wall biosynthesis
MSIDRIVVLSFCVLQYRNGGYYANEQIAEYLTELTENFDEVVVVANRSDKAHHRSRLDSSQLRPHTVRGDPKTNPILWTFSVLATYARLIRCTDDQTAVLYNFPAMIYAPVLPLLAHSASCFTGYIAMHPRSMADLHQRNGGLWGKTKAWLVVSEFRLVSAVSDCLLVRGDPELYSDHGLVYESNPIIKLTDRTELEGLEDTDPDEISLLYVGGFYGRKGLETLIRAFAKMLERTENDVRLRLVGGSGTEEMATLASLTDRLGISDAVEFVGTIDDRDRIARQYMQADVFVLPSLYGEGYPRVIEEAQYYGVPVIASRLESYEGLLEDGTDVVFARPESVSDLSEKIVEVVRNETLQQQLSAAGQSRMDSRLDESAAEQHSRIILTECCG